MSHDNDPIQLSLLVIDDDQQILKSVGQFLRGLDHKVDLAESVGKGLKACESGGFDIVITDIRLPDGDGFEVLRQVRERSPDTDVIMITGYGDIEHAFRAMREGAFDFFTKPLKVQELQASLERTVRFQNLRREKERIQRRLERLGADTRERYGLAALIGESSAMQEVKERIGQVCKSDGTTVLVTGETGSGKELVARAIHEESQRAVGPFVAVDCAAVSPTLFESAFYGHVKGAFTDAKEDHQGHFESADSGTLFLDEIGDMDLEMQSRLLRTLEERRVRPLGASSEIPVDVRVVSAANRDLPEAVAQGGFREDLLYRLNAFTIRIPPLRERTEDILSLAQHFLERYARELRKPVAGFSNEAETALKSHPFPGNIRELKNAVERAVILCRTDRILPGDLDLAEGSALRLETGELERQAGEVASGYLEQEADLNLEQAEKRLILEALLRADGSKTEAAKLLGISRNALSRRMERYQV